MPAKKKFNLVIILILALAACKKVSTIKSANNTDSNVDIYITAGFTSSENSLYWKNDALINLGTGYALAIAVNGSDVYVAGTSRDANGNSLATYWKNGAPVYLTQGLEVAYLNAIAINGTNVYAAGVVTGGNGQNVPTLWKNGVATNLPGGTDFYSGGVTSIALNGDDVYVAGFTADANDNYIATYWKNGSPVFLKSNSSNSIANAIAVRGNDIYIAGNTAATNTNFLSDFANTATYWKNGVAVNLTGSNVKAGASGIAISGTDVYVAGFTEDTNSLYQTTCWKNGIATILSPASPSYSTTAIAIFNNSIYITGEFYQKPGYWKDGTPLLLQSGNSNNISTQSSIVVVSH